MTKKTEKMAKMIGMGAAVGMVGAAAAAMTVGAAQHKSAGPRKKLAKDAKELGRGVSSMWNDVVSMMH